MLERKYCRYVYIRFDMTYDLKMLEARYPFWRMLRMMQHATCMLPDTGSLLKRLGKTKSEAGIRDGGNASAAVNRVHVLLPGEPGSTPQHVI